MQLHAQLCSCVPPRQHVATQRPTQHNPHVHARKSKHKSAVSHAEHKQTMTMKRKNVYTHEYQETTSTMLPTTTTTIDIHHLNTHAYIHSSISTYALL